MASSPVCNLQPNTVCWLISPCNTVCLVHHRPAPSHLTSTTLKEKANKVCVSGLCVCVCLSVSTRVCVWVCVREHTICSGYARRRWILQGEMRGAGADVLEEGVDIDWNGSRGEIAAGVYQHFTELINKKHHFHIHILFFLSHILKIRALLSAHPWFDPWPQVMHHTHFTITSAQMPEKMKWLNIEILHIYKKIMPIFRFILFHVTRFTCFGALSLSPPLIGRLVALWTTEQLCTINSCVPNELLGIMCDTVMCRNVTKSRK